MHPNHFDDLFLQAREISDPAARTAFLDEACAHQPELRSRLEALLADASAADAYFAEADTDMGATVRLQPGEMARAPGHAFPSTPTMIGPYRILERIGQGGMGDVFRAAQKEPIRREVALKLIKLGMDTQQVIARFEAERQALALMDHPHIARVLDAGADGQGHPYFVMELVRGVPITQYADEKQLTLRERLSLMQQVCQAIQHAHSKGVIHRDLKPSNILVSTQDGKPHAKVIDFGIAKATAQPLTDKTLFTHFQQFVGTPQYMSPEQAEGSLDIDTRSDVYALGVLLYELLTGGTPVEAATLRQAALHEIARIIKEQDTPKPSTRLMSVKPAPEPVPSDTAGKTHEDIRSGATTLGTLARARGISAEALIKTVRGELDWLVMKALDKDRARRYETPNHLCEDIARYLEGQPIVAAPPGKTYRMRKFIRKHRAPVLAAAAVLTLMTAGILGTSWGLLREKAAREEATRQARIAHEERLKAEAEKTEANKQRRTAETAKTNAENHREAAELESYIGNLAAAQAALTANDYPGARARLAVCPEKLRGWEWRFLHEDAKSMLSVFPKHLHALHFHPDAKRILVWDRLEDCLRLHDLEAGRAGPNIPLKGFSHGDRGHLAFTPDGKRLFCALLGESGEVRSEIWNIDPPKLEVHWNLPTSEKIQLNDYANDDFHNLAQISPDGQWFADKHLPLLHHLDGKMVRLYDGDLHSITGLKFLPLSDLVVVYHDEAAQIWNTSGKKVGPAMPHLSRIRDVQVSTGGDRLLVIAETDAQRWDSQGHTVGPRIHFTEHRPRIVMSPDGSWVVCYQSINGWTAWTKDGSPIHSSLLPRGWDLLNQSGQQMSRFEERVFAFSRDSKRLLINNPTPSMMGFAVNWMSWNMDGHPEYILARDNTEDVIHAAYTHKGDILRCNGSILELISPYGQMRARMTSRGPSYIGDLEFIHDSQGITTFVTSNGHVGPVAMSSSDGIDLGDGCPVFSHYACGRPVQELECLDGLEANSGPLHSIIEHRLTRQALRKAPETAALKIEYLSPSVSRILIPNKSIQIESNEILLTSVLHPDGTRLVAATPRFLIFWDSTTGRELIRFPVKKPADRLSFSPDGNQLGLLFKTGHGEIWDSRGHRERQNEMLLSEDDIRLAKAHVDTLLTNEPNKGDGYSNWSDLEAQLRNDSMLNPSVKEYAYRRLSDLFYAIRDSVSYHVNGRTSDLLFEPLLEKDILASMKEDWCYKAGFSKGILSEEISRSRTKTAKRFISYCVDRLILQKEVKGEDGLDKLLTQLIHGHTVTFNGDDFCRAAQAYHADPSMVHLERLYSSLARMNESTDEVWAAIALMHCKNRLFKEAQHCLRMLVPSGESVLIDPDPFDSNAALATKETFLIRNLIEEVIQAPDDYQPKGNTKRLSNKALPSIQQAMKILKTAEAAKP